jgi:hypothetical protein
MFRYIATAIVALMLLGIALRTHAGNEATNDAAPAEAREKIDAKVVAVPGGREITVQHRFAGRLSRASLVYEIDGKRTTADEANNCAKALATSSKLTEERYSTVVELSGRVPAAAEHVELIVEDETGVRALPVNLN